MGIGKVQFYASFGLLVGVWGNEASSSGFIAWAEVALRIKVFWVFSFGASVKAIFEQLGPQEPNYRRVSLEVRIETPWWLPDVTFRVERVRDSAAAGDDAGAVGAAADGGRARAGRCDRDRRSRPPTLGRAGRGAHRSPSCGRCPSGPDPGVGVGRAGAGQRRLRRSPSTSPSRSATRPPSCRAPPAGAGRQAATPPAQNQLSATYTLTQIGIRRRARFGPDAGVWTDLLAPADSEIGGLDDLLDDPDLERHASPRRCGSAGTPT